MNKKNIFFFTKNIESYTGAGLNALNLAKNIDYANIIIFNQPTRKIYNKNIYKDDSNGIKIYHINKGKIIILYLIYYLIKYRPQAIHFHLYLQSYMFLFNIMGRKTILKTNLLGSNDFKTLDKIYKNRNIFKRIIYNINKRLINWNIAQVNTIKIINSKVINKDKIKVVPNGVYINNINKLKKEGNKFIIVGAICPRKGVLEAIKYYEKNYLSINNSSLTIIGPYDDYNNHEYNYKYVKACLKYVNKYENKIYITGKISHKEVLKYMEKSLSLLMFSKYEGMPNVLLEAMANNCVPISKPIHGIATDIINNNVDGFIVDQNNPRNIELDRINNISLSCSTYYRANKYSWNNISKIYKKLYF